MKGFGVSFTQRGIPESRVVNLSGYNGLAYLEIYNQIDIVLDPFPFSGGCTSFDALTMGKPIITFKWSENDSEYYIRLFKRSRFR